MQREGAKEDVAATAIKEEARTKNFRLENVISDIKGLSSQWGSLSLIQS